MYSSHVVFNAANPENKHKNTRIFTDKFSHKKNDNGLKSHYVMSLNWLDTLYNNVTFSCSMIRRFSGSSHTHVNNSKHVSKQVEVL
jgi:hypothetical protein